MIVLVTCADYSIVQTVSYDFDIHKLPALCREIELARNDGYAVFARNERGHIADANGLIVEHDGNAVYRSLVDYACGYHD
jgi:hypothetical protein